MDADNCALASHFISQTYIKQGSQALSRRRKLIKTLLSQRRLPDVGWDDATIELFLQEAALMDSNNFLDVLGMGEREGRVASDLVARRHHRLAHGIGRSGEVTAEQPKAAGSSLLAKLTNYVVSDALHVAGIEDIGPCITLPMATGMTLTTLLLAVRPTRPHAKYVIWPRIDQKTCLKCIVAAGYEPIVVEMKREGDELRTDMGALAATIERCSNNGITDSIACILSTTSCFAPRGPDDVVGIAKLCAEDRHNIPHIINNAYGVQSRSLCSLITSAWRKGRVDAVVQSTDKNFMVPVGGAVVVGYKQRPDLVHALNEIYPGRASISPILDVLITLLHWGVRGWKKELEGRERVKERLTEGLVRCAQALGERVLSTPGNSISMAMTLDRLEMAARNSRSSSRQVSSSSTAVTFLGSMLFARGVSGARVIASHAASPTPKEVAGIRFQGYGASCEDYPHSYITAAAALGGSVDQVEEFIERLTKCYREILAKYGAYEEEEEGG